MWNKANGNPFYFTTEASVNLSEDPALMKLRMEHDGIHVEPVRPPLERADQGGIEED